MSLKDLAGKFRTRTDLIDEELYKQGDAADTMYIVVQGQVEQMITDSRGDTHGGHSDGSHNEVAERAVFQHGDSFGIPALIDDTWNYPGTAKISSAKAVLLELSRDDLEELIARDNLFRESVGELRDVGGAHGTAHAQFFTAEHSALATYKFRRQPRRVVAFVLRR